MRDAFIKKLTELAKTDKRIYLLAADCGYNVVEKFQIEHPERFFSMGIAEANAIGIAAGLAMEGIIPYVYSIAPFISYRCFEQIRLDVAYHNINVRLIGVTPGLYHGTSGPTHQATEDVAILRCLPNITIVCPGDPIETEFLIKDSLDYNGPIYFRLGKGDPIVHSNLKDFKIGEAKQIIEGTNIAILSCGSLLNTSKKVAEILHSKGISAALFSFPTVKPLDKKTLNDIVVSYNNIFSIEEHNLIGGFGSAILEYISDSRISKKIIRFGLPDKFQCVAGTRDYLLSLNQLSSEDIAKKIEAEYEK